MQIGINMISSSDNVVESKRVSFTLTSVDSSGESIDVSEAYVLPNLNQSRGTLPEQIDTIEYPHLRDVELPEVDINPCANSLVKPGFTRVQAWLNNRASLVFKPG